MSTPKKVLIVAAVCLVASLVSLYISEIPPSPDVFVPEDPSMWTVRNYAYLVFLVCALALVIAAFKLRR